MSDPLIRSCDHFVVLEPNQAEKLLTSSETLIWLKNWLEKLESIPQDLKSQPSLSAAAQRLLDTACDLQIKPGFTVQWFAVRLDPPLVN